MAAPTLTRYSTCFWSINASFSYYTGLIWSRLNYWYPCLTLESSAHRVLRPSKLPILSSSFFLSFWLFRAHSALTTRPTDIKTIPIGSTHSDSWSFVLFESFWNTFFQAITKQKQKVSPLHCWFGISLRSKLLLTRQFRVLLVLAWDFGY